MQAIYADLAWNTSTGSKDVVVCVTDTGKRGNLSIGSLNITPVYLLYSSGFFQWHAMLLTLPPTEALSLFQSSVYPLPSPPPIKFLQA